VPERDTISVLLLVAAACVSRMPFRIAAAWCGGLSAGDVSNPWPLDRLTEFVPESGRGTRLLVSSVTGE
jgi:hypothetical protein